MMYTIQCVLKQYYGFVIFLLCCICFPLVQYSIPGLIPWGWEGDLYHIIYTNLSQGQLPWISFFIEYPPLSVFWIAASAVVAGISQPTFLVVYSVQVSIASLVVLMYTSKILLQKIHRNIFKDQLFWLSLFFSSILIWTRYDIITQLLLYAGLSAWFIYYKKAHWPLAVIGGFSLSLGGVIKIFPFFALACFGLYIVLQKNIKHAVILALSASIPIISTIFFIVFGLGNAENFLQYQTGDRGSQIESIWGSILLLHEMLSSSAYTNELVSGSIQLAGNVSQFVSGFSTPLLLISFSFTSILLMYIVYKSFIGRASDYFTAIVLLSLSYLLAFLVWNKVFSPQYVIWITPYIAFLGCLGAPYTVIVRRCLCGVVVLTGIFYPWMYPLLLSHTAGVVLLVAVRNILLLTTLIITYIYAYKEIKSPTLVDFSK